MEAQQKGANLENCQCVICKAFALGAAPLALPAARCRFRVLHWKTVSCGYFKQNLSTWIPRVCKIIAQTFSNEPEGHHFACVWGPGTVQCIYSSSCNCCRGLSQLHVHDSRHRQWEPGVRSGSNFVCRLRVQGGPWGAGVVLRHVDPDVRHVAVKDPDLKRHSCASSGSRVCRTPHSGWYQHFVVSSLTPDTDLEVSGANFELA